MLGRVGRGWRRGGDLGKGGGPPTGLRWRAMSSSGSGHGCKLKGSEVITKEDKEREQA